MINILIKQIEQSSLPDNLKIVLAESDLQKKHKFYIQVVKFLHPIFNNITDEQVARLSFGAYLYFRYLLEFDACIDDNEALKGERIILANELHEESIKELSILFPVKSNFWKEFRKCKFEYFQTIVNEQRISKIKSDLTEPEFEKLASGKSAIVYATLMAMFELNTEKTNIIDIKRCLQHIHIAFQYLDDIDDFQEDCQKGQWTYAQHLVINYLGDKEHINDYLLLHKYLYISGIASNLVESAIHHYSEAEAISSSLNLTELSSYIEEQKKEALGFRKEIQLLNDKTKAKANKSNILKSGNSISSALNNGIEYLISNQTSNGLWTDFMSSLGSNNVWISSYVGYMLREINHPKLNLNGLIVKISENYEFNSEIDFDSNSLIFFLGLNWKVNKKIPDILKDKWLPFQNEDGGWAKHNIELAIRSRLDLSADAIVNGWLRSHPCISAATCMILSKIPELNKQYISTSEYLKNSFSNNTLHSYWWTSDIYTQSLTLIGINNLQFDVSLSFILCEQIMKEQSDMGYWTDPVDGESSAFYTAIALKSLLSCNFPNILGSIKKGVLWLANNQATDGSWLTNRIYRLPDTNVINPKSVLKWRNSSFGLNTLIDDHNRVFTTSTVINVLQTYQINKIHDL